MPGAFAVDCGWATKESTVLAPFFTVTHSFLRGDLSRIALAQSCAPTTRAPKAIAAAPAAPCPKKCLLETVLMFDALPGLIDCGRLPAALFSDAF